MCAKNWALFISEMVHQFVCLFFFYFFFIFFFLSFEKLISKKSDGAWFLKKKSWWVRRPQKVRWLKNEVFWRFDKNLTHSFRSSPFLLECGITNGIVSLGKNHISEKSASWVLAQKPLTNQNAGFFKLQYLRNVLSYEFLYVIRRS